MKIAVGLIGTTCDKCFVHLLAVYGKYCNAFRRACCKPYDSTCLISVMRVMTVEINVLKDTESLSPRRKGHLLGAECHSLQMMPLSLS